MKIRKMVKKVVELLTGQRKRTVEKQPAAPQARDVWAQYPRLPDRFEANMIMDHPGPAARSANGAAARERMDRLVRDAGAQGATPEIKREAARLAAGNVNVNMPRALVDPIPPGPLATNYRVVPEDRITGVNPGARPAEAAFPSRAPGRHAAP